MPFRRICDWWRRRKGRRAPQSLEEMMEAGRRRQQAEVEGRSSPPVMFGRDEVRELMHASESANLKSHRLWPQLQRHLEEHPGEGRW